MLVEREEAQANATKVKLMAEAMANKYKLTAEFLHLEAVKAITNNTRVK